VTPESGPPGTAFSFEAAGFDPGERVGVWITAPDQSTYGADFQATADGSGSIAQERIGLATDASFAEGIWSFNAQGVRSQRQAVGYFRIVASSTPGDPNKLGIVAHDGLPRQGEVFIFPVAAPAGYTFVLLAEGFQDEGVSAWISAPDGRTIPIPEEQVEAEGGSAIVAIGTGGLPDGVYTAVAQGRRSGTTVVAGFRITGDYVAGPGTPRPANTNGSATPPEVGIGGVVQIRGENLRPGEPLEFWVTEPSGAYTLLLDGVVAENSGRIGYDPPLDLEVPQTALAGVYGIHFRGAQSGVRVDVYFTVNRPAGRGLGTSGGWLAERLR
jgi:hypothetical protein